MKKLSTLIAIALIVTIGGVYAAWNYAQSTTASVNVSREVNMAQVVTNGNKGTITATPENNFAFLVDDGGSYQAVLNGTGNLKIVFTAAPGADQTTKDDGIKMQATVSLKTTTETGLLYTDPHKPEGQNKLAPITVKEENTITINGGNKVKPGEANGVTISAQEIVDCLQIANVVLDTKDENDKFHTALKDYTIYITISEIA